MNRSFLFFAVCIGWVSAAHLQAQEVPVIELKGHRGTVFYAAFSPDSKKVVTGGLDITARIWDAETGKELKVLVGHERTGGGLVVRATFSPDGKKVITGSFDGTARIWDAEADSTNFGQELLKLEVPPTHTVLSVAFSSDGKKVVTAGSEGTARIWNAESGEELKRLEGHTDSVWFATFSPDGKKALCPFIVALRDSVSIL